MITEAKYWSLPLTPDMLVHPDSQWEIAGRTALVEIQQAYANLTRPLEVLPYHSPDHALINEQRVVRILSAIQAAEPSLITDRTIAVARYFTLHHDAVIWSSLEEHNRDGIRFRKRKRHTGVSEHDSIHTALQFLPESATVKDARLGDEMIKGTIPAWDSERHVLIHPHITPESSLPALALAWADVGGAGMDGYARTVHETDMHFLEDYPDFFLAVLTGNFDNCNLHFYQGHMLDWLRGQQQFIESRAAVTLEQIKWLPRSIQDQVQVEFDQFEQTMNVWPSLIQKREQMSHTQWLQDAGYGEWHNRYMRRNNTNL